MPGRIWPALAVVLLGAACAKPSEPERVADAFADAYFRQMDQEKAKEFTALGASAMLDAEIRDVASIRKDGYGPDQASTEVRVQRGEPTKRDQRIRFPYEITVEADGSQIVRKADVELAELDGAWKVVRVGVEH